MHGRRLTPEPTRVVHVLTTTIFSRNYNKKGNTPEHSNVTRRPNLDLDPVSSRLNKAFVVFVYS